MSVEDRHLDPPDDQPTCSGCLIDHAPIDCPEAEDAAMQDKSRYEDQND